MPRVEYEKLSDDRLGEPSAAIRARVEAACARQHQRFQGSRRLTNADTPALRADTSVGPGGMREHCQLDGAGKILFCLMAVRRLLAAGSLSGYNAGNEGWRAEDVRIQP